MKYLLVQQPGRFVPTFFFISPYSWIYFRQPKNMKNIVRGMASPSTMRKLRQSCIYRLVCVVGVCTYLRYSAGILGATIDRMIETKGVRGL